MKFARGLFALAAVALLATLAVAEDQPKGPRGGRGGPGMRMDLFRIYERLDLSAEQKEKIEALKKEYQPKLEELGKKREGILTEDQKKALAEARTKSPEERRKAFQEAMNLSDEQKKQMDAVRADMDKLVKEIREKAGAVLTAEQKDKLEKMHSERGPGRGKEGRRRGGGAAPAKPKEA